MNKVRTNICLSPGLIARLRESSVNWSAVCEAALERALDEAFPEVEVRRLERTVRELEVKLSYIHKLSGDKT